MYVILKREKKPSLAIAQLWYFSAALDLTEEELNLQPGNTRSGVRFGRKWVLVTDGYKCVSHAS